jgi:hypothetical protein
MKGRTAAALLLATAGQQSLAGDWAAGSYACTVEQAVGIHVHRDQTIEGRLTPDPARFTLNLAPLDPECGGLSFAHTTVGIALRCAADSSTAVVGSELGGTLYQWAFPGQTFINIQGTILLQLARDGHQFMWTFTMPDYSSSYHGSCQPTS